MPIINLGKSRKRVANLHKREGQKTYQHKLWKSMRAEKFAYNPVCERCAAAGLTVPTEEVHHKVPIDVCPDLAFDWENLESLCLECHNIRHKELNKK